MSSTSLAPYRGKAFVYRQDELKFEADFYSEFFVAPAAMLSEATARGLAGANVFRRTISPGAADSGDYVLDGFVYRAVRRPARCLEACGGDRDHLLPVAGECVGAERDLDARIPAAHARRPNATPDAFARAWNAGLSAILADLARDLAATELPK